MITNFLPEDFDSLKMEKKYWKPSQFKEGDNKLRIVSRPIAGWIDWKDKKPYRFRPKERPQSSFDPSQPMKPFWVLYCWDYLREDLYVLDVTQASIIKALSSFGADEDWGDFTGYDIKIRKEGQGKDTEYSVTPLPHKPLNDKIKAAMAASPVRLEALYEGKDPWSDLVPTASIVNADTGEVKVLTKAEITEDEEQMFRDLVTAVKETSDPALLPDFIAHLVKERKVTVTEVVKQANARRKAFLNHFNSWKDQKNVDASQPDLVKVS